MEAEYSMCFDDGTEVFYFSGIPYAIDDHYGEYVSLDPGRYGYVDENGKLFFPDDEYTDRHTGSGLGLKKGIMLLMLGTLLFTGFRNGQLERVFRLIGNNRIDTNTSLTFGRNLNIPYLYASIREIEDDIINIANQFGVDPNLVAITILYESGGDASGDEDLTDVGIGQMTEGAMQTVNNYSTAEQRAYVGLAGGRYATMDDLISNKEIAAGYTTLLYKYYQDKYGIFDPEVLARMYNGGPGALNGPTTGLNAKYANDVGGLVNEVGLGMNGPTIQRLNGTGRIARP